jgi:hypothetical protein
MSTADLSFSQPPGHYNYPERAGLTLRWSGTDTQEAYNNHVRHIYKQDLLQKLSWFDATIDYNYNSHGYRSAEFHPGPCALALGCSFTEGTGLHIDQTWPSRLSQYLDKKVWNLGVAGSTIDTVFRILDYYIRLLTPSAVFVLIPPKERFEYKNIDGRFMSIHAPLPNTHQEFAKIWLAEPFNYENNVRKNLLAMQQLCKNFDANFFVFDSDYRSQPEYLVKVIAQSVPYDLARDLAHPGPMFHEDVAKIFYKKFYQTEEYQDE